MTRLMSEFSRKKWKDCCGKGCKKCAIAQAYIREYGKQDGLAKLEADRDAVKKDGKKGAKKDAKGRGDKKSRGKKKAKA